MNIDFSQASQCSDCSQVGFSEAECTVGVCGCSECDRVTDETRGLMGDDLFNQAVEQVKQQRSN